MTTVAEIVSRSLRLLGVLDANKAPSGSDYGTAILTLNAMVQRWEANGMALGWASVSDPGADIPLPPEAEQAVAFNLAVLLAPEYGITPNAVVVGFARDGLSELRRDRLVSSPLTLTSDLPRTYAHFNIITDEPV
jgi:hypothetical protein